MSQRTKRKHMQEAGKLVPQDDATALDYALGGGGALPPSVLRWALFGGWIVLTLVISLLLKTVVLIGALPMIAIFFAVNKPRGVLLSDRGLASMRCGFFNGRPSDLLAVGPLISLDQRLEHRWGSTKLQIGDDQVWLADKDLAELLRLAPRPSGPTTPPPGVF